MAVDSAPSQVATSALTSIPFGQIIGAPLKAAIEAQAMAAQTTWNFIQEVGLNTDKETGEKKAVNVSFDFYQDGKEVRLNVPLLTIVPIPYIAINSIDIAFKAKINAESSSHNEASESSSTDVNAKVGGNVGFGCFKANFEASAGFSSKKDSKSTQDSKYSVEYTLDITVKAGQDSMPAGLARVLDILNNCISVNNPKGELGAGITSDEAGNIALIATYRDSNGVFQPEAIKCTLGEGRITNDGRSAIFDILAADRGKDIEVKVEAETELKKSVKVPAALAE
ncbi:MAG: DUF2589 domain-containing protein [Planctomycetaceae bacterium]|jgi:hypothetical protein|nr:DUF2589 domain-containing protein [Planctomycetaceae bacterium]